MSKMIKPVQILQLGNAADIYIYGDLVASQWFDDETSPDSFRREVQALTANGVNELNVHIDSYGGAISTGWAIYNVLKDFPGTVNAYADGFVASAAIYPFLAASKRVANPMSAFFLHQGWTYAQGNADELRKAADDLEIINDLGLEAFAAVGISKEKALELEKAETWLRPAEALELGIATEITDRAENGEAQQSARAVILQALLHDAPLTGQKAPETHEAEEVEITPEQHEEQKKAPVDGQKASLRDFLCRMAN